MMDPIEMRRSVFNPELDALIDSLVTADQAALLQAQTEA